MSSSDDKKLPTSTLARSFSAQLNDIFLLDDTILSKEKEVEQKKLELTQQNAELDALEQRLKRAEEQLVKKSKRISLITSEMSSPTTPTNTEVGNPLTPNKSPRRRNPIPAFGETAVETENAAGEGDHDIANDSAPEPPKKDDPVVLHAPRALPVFGGEIEACREEHAQAANWDGAEGDRRGGVGGTPGGGRLRKGGRDREAIRGTSASVFQSTFASPDVTEQDPIQITFGEEQKLPKLRTERQGEPGAAPPPPPLHAKAASPQQQPTLSAAGADEGHHAKQTPDSESAETYQATPANAAAYGQAAISTHPDEDGDEHATGALIDQYGYSYDDHDTQGADGSGHHEKGTLGNGYAPRPQPVSSNRAVPGTAAFATSRPDRSDDIPRNPVRDNASSSVPTAAKFQESANTKYLLTNDLSSFPPSRPGRAGTITKTELPPLPGQTPDIPKRKPVRGYDEQPSKTEMTTTSPMQTHTSDRPPTPPSKIPRSIVHATPLQQDHTYTYNPSSIVRSPAETMSRPLVPPPTEGENAKPWHISGPLDNINNGLDAPNRESITERGFGGLLKMKKSLQGLRKKAQAAASSPISPSSDQQRSFSTGSPGYPPADAKLKDDQPLPPIPFDKPPAGVMQLDMPPKSRGSAASTPPPPTPQAPLDPANMDVFDRVQAQLNNQHQQQDEPSPRRFEGKHKKAFEAIAKFSKIPALRAMRKRETREENPSPQEPPLASWEIEQRASRQLNSPGQPLISPQGNAQVTQGNQTSTPQANGFIGIQTPISPIKDDALPALPPPLPSKTGDRDSEDAVERPSRSTSIKPLGLPILPHQATIRFDLDLDFSSPPAEIESDVQVSVASPPPAAKVSYAEPLSSDTLEFSKHLDLQLSGSGSLTVDNNSSGLLSPASSAFSPGREGRPQTYSFLDDYYFGAGDADNADDDAEEDEATDGPPAPLPQAEEPDSEPPTDSKETKKPGDYRIKSFAPFSIGDLSSELSFDSFGKEEKPPPMPVLPKMPVGLPSAPNASLPPSLPSSLPSLPPKDDGKPRVVPETSPERTPKKGLPETPKPAQRSPPKPEVREEYRAPLQTVAHRSILSSATSGGRESTGPPSLPMKDIPEEGPYPATKATPLNAERPMLSGTPNTSTSATTSTPVNKAGYASSAVSSVRSSSGGYTESPSASTPRTSLSSSDNRSTNPASAPGTRVPSGEQGSYPTRMSSQAYQSQGHSPSQDRGPGARVTSGPAGFPPNSRPQNMPPQMPSNMPPNMPHGGPQGMPPRGRMPGPPGPPGPPGEFRGRPGFRPPPGGPMGPGYPPRSSSPAFSEGGMRIRGPPPPRSASPAFSERRGPVPPRSSSPAFSMRGDPRMYGPPRNGPYPPQNHQRKKSNGDDILEFAVDFELPASALRYEAKEAQSKRSRSASNGLYGNRGPPPGAYPRRAESPGPREGFRPGSRARSRGPMGMPHGGPPSRPESRTSSPFRHPPVSHNFNGPPRGPPGSRRNSGGSNAGGGSRKPSLSEAEMDIALGVGQIPGQERKYRPPPQMRGGRPPQGPTHMQPSPGKGLKGLTSGGISYPGLEDAFGMMDSGGRMPGPTIPRREGIA
ncbi:hypothetical protein ABW21_db0208940 [Orbilia brochopaga]|nr:hypothetical protein ABW21_db0208940 [Drechslerella brochopaga]